MTQGIDVSHIQGSIDWLAAKTVGAINFAFIKASEGVGYHDSMFVQNWTQAKAAGVFPGAYHFFHPEQDAQAQAECFLRALAQANGNTTLQPGCLPCVLDVEKVNGCTPELIAARVNQWLDTVETATGVAPIIYTGWGYWNAAVAPAMPLPAHLLWVAEYGVSNPRLPIGFLEWTFWQNGQAGKVAGVPGQVDTDVFNGAQSDLAALARCQA